MSYLGSAANSKKGMFVKFSELIAKQHQLTLDACPYFSQKETMERYLSAEAEAAR
jgi:hypothetical protein